MLSDHARDRLRVKPQTPNPKPQTPNPKPQTPKVSYELVDFFNPI
jgi:hypothetical protein